MAKGKHAAALFEVIHSGRYANKPVMNTPKWWFKRNKSKDSAGGETGSSSAPTSTTEDDPTARAGSTASSQDFESSSSSDPTAGRSPFDRIEEPAEESQRPHASVNNLDVAVDRDRRLITLKVSYNSAIITAFTLLVVLSLAYVVGRKMSRGPLPAIASQTSDQLRAGPARPDVMNVAPTGRQSQQQSPPQGGSTLPQSTQTMSEPEGGTTSNPPPAPGADTAGQTPAGSSPASSARMVGLNYTVIQSYPDESSAIEARDALVKAGVGCTIERNVRGFPSGFVVVGTQGFSRVSGQDYQQYLKKIEQVSYDLTRSRRGAKPFAPTGKKWDKPVEEPRG